MFDIYLHQFNF